MGDPATRKNAQLIKLRHQLQRKRESLADQFDYKMYVLFHFKDENKACAAFEIAEVVPVMTNNYEDRILKGVKDNAYTLESSKELLEKDIVQLHAPRWQSLRSDILGATMDMDFFLWPRNDIECIQCLLFSRWKDEPLEPYRPLMVEFFFTHLDYEKQLMRLIGLQDKSCLIVNNPDQSLFLFVGRHCIESAQNKAIFFKLSSLCLYLPQDKLTQWGSGSVDEVLNQNMNTLPNTRPATL